MSDGCFIIQNTWRKNMSTESMQQNVLELLETIKNSDIVRNLYNMDQNQLVAILIGVTSGIAITLMYSYAFGKKVVKFKEKTPDENLYERLVSILSTVDNWDRSKDEKNRFVYKFNSAVILRVNISFKVNPYSFKVGEEWIDEKLISSKNRKMLNLLAKKLIDSIVERERLARVRSAYNALCYSNSSSIKLNYNPEVSLAVDSTVKKK